MFAILVHVIHAAQRCHQADAVLVFKQSGGFAEAVFLRQVGRHKVQPDASVAVKLHPAQMVQSGRPDATVLVHEQTGEAARARRVDRGPRDAVPHHEAFEVGHIDAALAVGQNLVAHIVGAEFAGGDVVEEGQCETVARVHGPELQGECRQCQAHRRQEYMELHAFHFSFT